MLNNPNSIALLTISVFLILGALYLHKTRKSSDNKGFENTDITPNNNPKSKSDSVADGFAILIIEAIFWSLALGAAYFSVSVP